MLVFRFSRQRRIRRATATRIFRLVIVVVSLTALSSCSSPDADYSDDPALAEVDSESISVSDFEQSYVAFLIGTGQNDTRRNRYRHLQSMIDNILMANEANALGLDKDSLYLAFVDRETRKALGGRFYEVSLLEKMEPPEDAEIRQAFAASKDKVVVRHLFFKSASEARSTHERLLAGADFVDEAQRVYRTATFDSTAGYLGPISYFSVDDAFAEAAFKLGAGEVSAPVRSRFGYHIIMVEDRIRNPLITESEYQTRKKGVTEQLKLRRRRLEGDTFIRSYMEGLNVSVNTEGVAALNDAIKALENRVGDQPVQINNDYEAVPFDMGALRESFGPETVLATYSHLGEEKEFTAGDYYFWLRDLPFEEASKRTAASVGRALRNEVLAEAGRELNLESDPKVVHEVDLAARNYLASVARLWLSNQPASEPNEELLRDAYVALGLDRTKHWTATFWVVPARSVQEASSLKESLTGGSEVPESEPGFVRYKDVRIDEVEDWGRHVQATPLREMTVVGLEDGTAGVVFVEDKEATSPEFDDYRGQLRESILPHVNEYNAVNARRSSSAIAVDTTLFELIMDL